MRRNSCALLVLALGGVVLSAASAAGFELQWQSSGVHEQVRGFRPHALLLSPVAPSELKRAPEGLTAPAYGAIELGPKGAPAKFLVIVDAFEARPARLFVDSNADGDLTDDPACTITNRVYQGRDGKQAESWEASAQVSIPFASGPRTGTLRFYVGGMARTTEGKTVRLLQYYTDYGLVGDLSIDGQKVPAVMQDAGAVGRFELAQEVMRNPLLWLGVTNPATGRRGMTVAVQRPFEFNGKWWAVTNLTSDGKFEIAAATKPKEQPKEAAVDLSPGRSAPAFTARLLDGKTVRFPQDYKGKVVLLDFWATWCGPCVAEIPNVVKAYERFHAQGFEVLGISLDREDASAKVSEFTRLRNMPWPQVYDGKYWQAEVAKLYGINAIPHMLLVDGETGKILANKTIRGDALAPAIQQALSNSKK